MIPGVTSRAKGAVLVGAAHGELIHVQLADNDGFLLLDAGNGRSVVRGDVIIQNARRTGGTQSGGIEDVFCCDRQPRQGLCLAIGDSLISRLRFGERRFVADGDKSVEGRIGRRNAVKVSLCDLDRRDFPFVQFGA